MLKVIVCLLCFENPFSSCTFTSGFSVYNDSVFRETFTNRLPVLARYAFSVFLLLI